MKTFENLQYLKSFYHKNPAIYSRMNEKDFLFLVCDNANDLLMENTEDLKESANFVLNECLN